MYSLMLMTAMSTSPQAPEFHGFFRNLFRGGCYGSCEGRSYGCGGSASYSCRGCDGGLFSGDRIRALFNIGGGGGCGGCYGRSYDRPYGCYGASYSCQGCSGYALSCQGGMSYAPPPMSFVPPAGDCCPPGGGMGYPAPSYPVAPGLGVPSTMPPMSDGPYAEPRPAPTIDLGMASYRNQLPSPGGLVPASASRGTVVVRLPADARLYAEGRLLQLTSAERTFVTPELPGSQDYTYTFRAEYERNGEVISRRRTVSVRAGAVRHVAFEEGDSAKRRVPTDREFVNTPAEAKPPAPAATPAAPAVPEPLPAAPRPGTVAVSAPEPKPVPTEPAKIVVKLPPGATLFIDDRKHERTEPVREFATPPLPKGREFRYTMTVKTTQHGLPFEMRDTVVVRAGESTAIDFTTLPTAGGAAHRAMR